MLPRLTTMRVFLLYFLTIFGCSLILVLSLGLWNADLKVPFYYEHGCDLNFMLGKCKTINDTGWFTVNPMMGAPGTMQLYDYPTDVGIYLRTGPLQTHGRPCKNGGDGTGFGQFSPGANGVWSICSCQESSSFPRSCRKPWPSTATSSATNASGDTSLSTSPD